MEKSKILSDLKNNNIGVTTIEDSKDLDLDDSLINLQNGYYLTFNPFESYIMLWQNKGKSHQLVAELNETNYCRVLKSISGLTL